ncbi:MAG: hypothetical protein P1V20_07475 [Verrucomicrobiales bacterium]|nr:hypothetical protein [Verrucomicrobiales bacterium]
MKKTAITTALLALTASFSFADHHDHHDDHHYANHGHHEDLAHQTQTKGALLKRLAIAPSHHGYGHNIHAVEQAALSAHNVKMLGKVEYEYGKSWLGSHSKHAIEDVILRSRIEHGPNTLIVVLGYADRTGRAHINYRLSDTRATNVQKHIDHINWEHRLEFRTTSIPMGEEVELCEHHLGHNRVAEIWLVEFPKPVAHFFHVNPVVEHHTVERHVVAAPVQKVVTTIQQPQPQIIQAPAQQVTVQTAPQIVTQPVAVNPLAQLAEFLENNVMLAPNADPNEFARQLSILKTLGN